MDPWITLDDVEAYLTGCPRGNPGVPRQATGPLPGTLTMHVGHFLTRAA
jgi:hypothetical protein